MDLEELRKLFTYHPPKNKADIEKYQRVRVAAHKFAITILQETPSSADQSAAIRKIREAVMTANAAIALDQSAGTDKLFEESDKFFKKQKEFVVGSSVKVKSITKNKYFERAMQLPSFQIGEVGQVVNYPEIGGAVPFPHFHVVKCGITTNTVHKDDLQHFDEKGLENEDL